MGIFYSILAIFLMIILHEWGHFIAGRICKVPVYEFAIGFGPKLFSFKGKKGTTYTIRAIPIGGFCSFDDLESLKEISGKEATKAAVVDSALDNIEKWKTVFISIAGPAMNIITAFVVILITCLLSGKLYVTNIVKETKEDMPAYGLFQEDDEIIEANGLVIKDGDDLTEAIVKAEGKEIEITFIRDGKKLKTNITPIYVEEYQRYMIGLEEKSHKVPVTFLEAVKDSFNSSVYYIKSTYEGLYGLITGKYKARDVSGIIGAVDTMGDYAKKDTIVEFFSLVAFISINLGIMNLMPIPGLDGSKILLAFIETIIRKRIDRGIIEKITVVSFSLLLILAAFVAVSDILKIIN